MFQTCGDLLFVLTKKGNDRFNFSDGQPCFSAHERNVVPTSVVGTVVSLNLHVGTSLDWTSNIGCNVTRVSSSSTDFKLAAISADLTLSS